MSSHVAPAILIAAAITAEVMPARTPVHGEPDRQAAEKPLIDNTPIAKTPSARLIANPFYLGEAMLSPTTTLGDLDDAVVYFRK